MQYSFAIIHIFLWQTPTIVMGDINRNVKKYDSIYCMPTSQ